MSEFDEETRMVKAGDDAYLGKVHGAWNIGNNPNGGYLLSLVMSALRQAAAAYQDPISVTVHFLRPGLPDQPCRVETRVLRTGRNLATVRATLIQDGAARLEVLAALGDLSAQSAVVLSPAMPVLPPPEACVPRSSDEQGVGLPILDRLDIRLHPEEARARAAGKAQVTGWIRFRDGRPPDSLSSLLFADTFPPAVFGLLGVVGWVPTVELTVHVRRRPEPGWMLGQFRSSDLSDGRLIEDGALWDSRGNLIVQSRQLALVRQGETKA